MSDDRDNLVPFSRPRRRLDPARLAEFATTAKRIQQERETSPEIVDRLLRDTPRERWSELAACAELQTNGALERLGQLVDASLYREPLESLAIAELATTIADAVRDYPVVTRAQLRAHAWKDRGHTLAYLSRYDEALTALDVATSTLEPFGSLAHDRAIVEFIRATTLQNVNRFDESLALLTNARMVFEDHADTRRSLLCGIAEGALLYRLHRYREAREVFALLLPHAEANGDEECVASLHSNIASCAIETAAFDVADHHLSRAAAILAKLGQTLHVLRTEVLRARLLLRRGEKKRGIAHLYEMRRRFLAHGLVEEAGICGLDLVEALLPSADAAALARQLVAEFTAAKLATRAITALGHLYEAVARNEASAETVAEVRQHLRPSHGEPRCPSAGKLEPMVSG